MCEVINPFLSTTWVVSARNRIVVDAEGCFVEDELSQERFWVSDQSGMFSFRFWVRGGLQPKDLNDCGGTRLRHGGGGS